MKFELYTWQSGKQEFDLLPLRQAAEANEGCGYIEKVMADGSRHYAIYTIMEVQSGWAYNQIAEQCSGKPIALGDRKCGFLWQTVIRQTA